ncbi:(-)-isopiperitenol/(-)-carveol dehydrogenase, mitochondrial-like [Cornus florida]|uniref:(-)-isopiperitenol/(-)-carveol dehydrogenase, mitochondrial-like n=1 Tax=Cornus florida TaxID=4283 RepID=UPI00289D3E94|nr:(-)-isopiperitenol/(-)-carveol dehydrogenase, mitochondrial-like [Cornus florida]
MAEMSMNKLEGKVAIITGGASGIGEETARLFAAQGARAVVIADIQDERGRRVAESIGPNCSYIHCDVADEHQVKDMVESTVKIHGQLDIMFSNAGIISPSDQKLLDLDFSEFDRLFAVNVRGMAACVKQAARVMVQRRVRGSIVCTASVAGSKGGPKRTDYYMSKHAVIGLVRSASRQLGEHGIRVNSVSPYAVATPFMCRAYQKEEEEMEKLFEPLTCLKGTVLKAKHVADAVLFLASDDSAFISGHDLVVDGVQDSAFIPEHNLIRDGVQIGG